MIFVVFWLAGDCLDIVRRQSKKMCLEIEGDGSEY